VLAFGNRFTCLMKIIVRSFYSNFMAFPLDSVSFHYSLYVSTITLIVLYCDVLYGELLRYYYCTVLLLQIPISTPDG
jgi:hypothetical protein